MILLNTNESDLRFVIAGTKMLDAIEPLATGVFRFDREYKLTYDQVNAPHVF